MHDKLRTKLIGVEPFKLTVFRLMMRYIVCNQPYFINAIKLYKINDIIIINRPVLYVCVLNVKV